jgi:hypothetical protein
LQVSGAPSIAEADRALAAIRRRRLPGGADPARSGAKLSNTPRLRDQYADCIGRNAFGRAGRKRPPPQQVPRRNRLSDFARRVAAGGTALCGEARIERKGAKQQSREKKRTDPQAFLPLRWSSPIRLCTSGLSRRLRAASSFQEQSLQCRHHH